MNRSVASPSPRGGPARGRRGFTLVEIMVAMSVLALIMVLMAQMIGAVGRDSRFSAQRVNNLTKARALLNILAEDLKSALYRDDLAFYPAASQPYLAFYTQANGGSGSTRNVTLVQYYIDTTSNSDLNRNSLAVGWTSPASAVSFGNAATLPQLSEVSTNGAVPGVVGFQTRFLLSDGTIQSTYTNTPSNPLRAVSVTLAVVDDQSLALLAPSQLSTLQSQLAAAAPPNGTVKKTWETALDEGSLGQGVPRPVLARIHVFERSVYVLPTF